MKSIFSDFINHLSGPDCRFYHNFCHLIGGGYGLFGYFVCGFDDAAGEEREAQNKEKNPRNYLNN
jgi:hypothetical protein